MNEETTDQSQMARPLAPEDVRPDQYVSVMHELREQVPWCFDEDKTEPRRFLLLPRKTYAPLRIVDVCVPFVLVEQVNGTHRTLDLRRCRLADTFCLRARDLDRRIEVSPELLPTGRVARAYNQPIVESFGISGDEGLWEDDHL